MKPYSNDMMIKMNMIESIVGFLSTQINYHFFRFLSERGTRQFFEINPWLYSLACTVIFDLIQIFLFKQSPYEALIGDLGCVFGLYLSYNIAKYKTY
ncbi:MAG: hypothetical protein QXO84_02705 [Candidatus Aenigmatarchaeota archaeon]